MHALLSLWTSTTKFELSRGPMLACTLAIAHASKVFPTIEFCSDHGGIRIAKELGWYSHLDFINPYLATLHGNVTPHIWALGKLHAIKTQSRPFCQFDLDVMIRKPLPSRLSKAAIFAQSIDMPSYYASEDIARAIAIARLATGGYAYNCGIIGGNDVASLHAYAGKAIDMALRFFGKPINGTAVSMVIEQYFLGEFCRQRGIRLETLLPPNPSDSEAEAAGYTHLHGQSKHDPVIIEKMESRMINDFPAEYEAFERGWHKITDSGKGKR